MTEGSGRRDWAPLEIHAAALNGWRQVSPLFAPIGSKATVHGSVEFDRGEPPFFSEGALAVRVEIAPPEGGVYTETVFFERRGQGVLTDVEDLVKHLEGLGAGDGLYAALAALDDEHDRVLLADGGDKWPTVGSNPPLDAEALNAAVNLAEEWARLDELENSGRVVGTSGEVLAALPVWRVRAMLRAAYHAGREVRRVESHKGRKAGPGRLRGLQLTAQADSWQGPCLEWARSIVRDWPDAKGPTVDDLADGILEKWAERGFAGGPLKRGKPSAEPPSHDTLVGLIRRWKQRPGDPLTGMRKASQAT